MRNHGAYEVDAATAPIDELTHAQLAPADFECRLPATFGATRDALRALACYVIAPVRKAQIGRIGLAPRGRGFGTPPFEDGSVIAVDADRLVRRNGDDAPITTLRAAARFVGVELSATPGVGDDLPAYQPDVMLAVDAAASLALGAWYSFGSNALSQVRARYGARWNVSVEQLWPEHFDIGITLEGHDVQRTNIGCSPGDAYTSVPYLYVAPSNIRDLDDPFWDAPFGATLSRDELFAERDTEERAVGFYERALTRLDVEHP